MLFKIFFILSLCSLSAHQEVQTVVEHPLLNPLVANRKTSKIILDNGMHIYLISDPGAHKSAAAVAVRAGSWEDPRTRPGMAHFLEHTLFLGSKAYPEEEGFFKYIMDRGGVGNAYTAVDRTVYMFSVNNEHFENALDRLAHFFIDPLFAPSGIGRELHAVDQEHAKNIENDGWRQWMILKETGNPDHPNVLFSTGTAKTLGTITRTELKEWYEKNYTPDRMYLVVYSPLPLEVLKKMAIQDFSLVESRPTSFSPVSKPLLSSSQKGRFLYIKPIKELRTLSLAWEYEGPFANDKTTHTAELIAHLFDDQSKKSLSSFLEKEGLVESLSASSDKMSSENLFFSLDIRLTKEGLIRLREVIEHCFALINRLKLEGVPSELFDEMKNLSKIKYQYQTRSDPFEYVSHLAHHMPDEDFASFPEKTCIPTSYDKKLVSRFLEHMTPQNCLFILTADPQEMQIHTDKKEKWMGAEYTLQALPIEQIQFLSEMNSHPSIELPSPNKFTPDHLMLLEEEGQKDPLLLLDDERGCAYFVQDTEYKEPKISWHFHLKSPLLDGSAKSSVLISLYLKSLEEQLRFLLSSGDRAGIEIDTGFKDLKMHLLVEGYSEKASLFLKEFLAEMKMLELTEKQFLITKESLLMALQNSSKELPINQGYEVARNILFKDMPPSLEKAEALKTVTYESFQTFSKELFKETYIETFLYGNMTQSEAKSVLELVYTHLSLKPYSPSRHNQREALLLPGSSGPFMVLETTDRLGYAAILCIQAGELSFEKKAAQATLSKLLQESFFTTLRTKQQTAYIAKSFGLEEGGQLSHWFSVQSSSHLPQDLIGRFEVFIEDICKDFGSHLSKERFETIKGALIAELRQPPKNGFAFSKKLDSLAFYRKKDFKWMEKLIVALEQLSYQDLKNYTQETFARTNLKRVAVLVEGAAPSQEFRYEIVNLSEIKALSQYFPF